MKKYFIFSLVSLIALVYLTSLVLGATITTISPLKGTNNTATLNFTCNASQVTLPLNASLVYNAGYGALNTSSTILATVANSSANQTLFSNGAVSITGLTDSRQHNMTCLVRNGTGANNVFLASASSASNLTADNTAPTLTLNLPEGSLYNQFDDINISVSAVTDLTETSCEINTTDTSYNQVINSSYFNTTTSCGLTLKTPQTDIAGNYKVNVLITDIVGLATTKTYIFDIKSKAGIKVAQEQVAKQAVKNILSFKDHKILIIAVMVLVILLIVVALLIVNKK